MDDDARTTSALLRRAERECMRDLHDAIYFRKELDQEDDDAIENV
jgi:hypothetical protein